LVAATARALDLAGAAPVPLVADGGLIRAQADLLLPPLLSYARGRGLAVAHRLADVEAAHGALALAREALGAA
jgi:hypothetical protein